MSAPSIQTSSASIDPPRDSAPAEPDAFPDVNLIDQLLRDQQQLQTPVARFAEEHDRANFRTDLYKHLIPLEKPQPGEQYAFQVELDRCTGCKACVVACHTLNGLDEDEAWRDVGLLEDDSTPGFQQTVTSACHHCLDPECLNGCPVEAYEKEEDTGIVKHLDDQCIGCEYCVLKCPYDVPKYSAKRGIVRKCDMCHQRLAVGEAPACVQACPTEAISIIKVDTAALRTQNTFLPGAPGPEITRPTTRYVGRDVPETATAAHQRRLDPQPAHWPLALMLTLTQAGLGLAFAHVFHSSAITVVLGTLLFFAGMGSAVLHLGKPLKAWRFFLGLRTSWLSREILAFSIVAPILLTVLATALFPELIASFTGADALGFLQKSASYALIPVGLLAIFTSVMIYHDTRRENWHLRFSAPAFFGTTAAFTLLTISPEIFTASYLLLVIYEGAQLLARPGGAAGRQAALRLGPLRKVTAYRFGTAAAALALVWLHPLAALPFLIASELISRHLFFRSVHAPKMPGGLAVQRAPHN